MPSLTFPIKTVFQISWTLTSTTGSPINAASLVGTLYAGRSPRDPDQIPGTPVSPIVNLAFSFVSNGLYVANVPGTLDPPLDGVGYILVLDATLSATPIYHSENPVVIETAGASIDLTTVDLVKSRAGVTSNTDDDEIQAAITAFSQHLLNWTGQASLNSIVTLDEFYDGNGNDKLFLRSYPIRNINFVKIFNTQLPLSASPTSFGVYIGQSGKYIGLRGLAGNFTTFPYPNYSWYGGTTRKPTFLRGSANVEVNYDMGFNDTPADLEVAVRNVVAINYKRKGWQDQASRVVTGGGTSATTRYRDWVWPPEDQRVFDHYLRGAIIV